MFSQEDKTRLIAELIHIGATAQEVEDGSVWIDDFLGAPHIFFEQEVENPYNPEETDINETYWIPSNAAIHEAEEMESDKAIQAAELLDMLMLD